MTANQFVYWLRGYLVANPDSQMKTEIQATLEKVAENAPQASTRQLLSGNTTITYGTPDNITYTTGL